MKRVAAVACAVGALLATSAPSAHAQAAQLGGFQGVAGASGLQIEYTPQGVLPIPSIVDVGAPDAVASISSGPTTFAQAAVLDPGDLLSNPDALLTLAGIIPGYQQGTIPPYPYRISANSGFGEPAAESAPGPGLNVSVKAEPNGSTARATTAASDAAPVATLGSMLAEATTKTDGSSVTVRSLSRASGVSILGMITIDSVVTDLTAVSRPDGVKLSGATKVVGAKLAGRPVTIDATGVHVEKNRLPIPASVGKSVNDALKRAGITITLSAPSSNQVSGRLASSGLRVGFDNSVTSVAALDALFNALPPLPGIPIPNAPSPEDIIVAIKARHVGGFEIGRGVVSLATRGAFFEEETPFIPDLGTDVGGFDLGGALPGVSSLVPTGRAPTLGRSQNTGSTASGVSPFGVGIGGLLLVALLLQPFLGQGLARLSNTLLASGAEHCDLEDL